MTTITPHHKPLSTRIFYVCAFLAVLTGCGEAKDWAADQASLADAIAQAAKEAGR